MKTNRNRNVLVVDDEPNVTRAIARALRNQPYRVLTAENATEALELMARYPVHLICSDEQMPGMSGSRLLEQVRRQYPDAVRIILTGHADLQAAMRAVNEAKVHRFIQKPCPTPELADVFAEALATLDPSELEEQRRGKLDAAFDEALDKLWMAAQPIVDLRDDSVYGWELLMRSESEQLPYPDKILDAARELERMVELERKVRELSAKLAGEVPEGKHLFVNISPAALGDPDLYDAGAPLSRVARRVVLEITEEARVSTPDLAARITELRELGYAIAVDDVGAGYAGLNSLALIGPNIAKIDRELVNGITSSPTGARLVRSMLDACRDLGMLVVAEGVETAEQLELLREWACPLAQGYLLARPGRPFPAPQWPQTQLDRTA